MTESIKKNYIYNLISQILTMIIPVITTPYISRTLGPQAIGDFSYSTGIVSYFCIFSLLGTANYAQREIAKKHHSIDEVTKLFFEILLIRILCITIVLIFYIFFINLPYWADYKLILSVQILSFISWGLDISWLYQGLEKFKVTAFRNSIIKILSTIFIFIFVKKPGDLIFYTAIYCASDILGNLSMWLQISKNINRFKISHLQFRYHIHGILALFIPNIALQLYTVFDKTMLGSMVSTLEVGYYSQAEKIIKIIVIALSSLATVLMPRFAYLNEIGAHRQAELYYEKSIDYTIALSFPMTAGCILVAQNFVPLFFGTGYNSVISLLRTLSFLFIIMSMSKMFGTILIAYNKQRIYTLSVFVAASVNILLNAFFILAFDMASLGVAIASVIAEIIAMIIQIIFLPQTLNKGYVFEASLRYMKPTLLMTIIIITLNQVNLSHFMQLLLNIIIGGLFYLFWLFFTNDPLFTSILGRLDQNKNNQK